MYILCLISKCCGIKIKTEICKFKPLDNIPHNYFCLGSASKGFADNERSESSVNGTLYNFSTEFNLIGKENIRNVPDCFLKRHNVKYYVGSSNRYLLLYCVLEDL